MRSNCVPRERHYCCWKSFGDAYERCAWHCVRPARNSPLVSQQRCNNDFAYFEQCCCVIISKSFSRYNYCHCHCTELNDYILSHHLLAVLFAKRSYKLRAPNEITHKKVCTRLKAASACLRHCQEIIMMMGPVEGRVGHMLFVCPRGCHKVVITAQRGSHSLTWCRTICSPPPSGINNERSLTSFYLFVALKATNRLHMPI